MYDLNRYGKIVVDSKEVYYGCITEINIENELVKLFVVDWRDKDTQTKTFNEMIVPISKFTIKYLESEN